MSVPQHLINVFSLSLSLSLSLTHTLSPFLSLALSLPHTDVSPHVHLKYDANSHRPTTQSLEKVIAARRAQPTPNDDLTVRAVVERVAGQALAALLRIPALLRMNTSLLLERSAALSSITQLRRQVALLPESFHDMWTTAAIDELCLDALPSATALSRLEAVARTLRRLHETVPSCVVQMMRVEQEEDGGGKRRKRSENGSGGDGDVAKAVAVILTKGFLSFDVLASFYTTWYVNKYQLLITMISILHDRRTPKLYKHA